MHRRTCRLLALLPVCAALWAQPPNPSPAQDAPIAIDMARVVGLVQNRNLEVQASREGITAAKEKVGEARALRLGRVGVDASYIRFDDPISITSPPV
jgi:outer membrane protein TolC